MTYLLDQATNIATGILIMLLVFVAIGVIIFVSTKKKRQTNIKEDVTDYSTFERKDTLDYIKIDDIRDEMIITDNGKRFIGVIKCHGFDFYSEDYSVKSATCRGYYGFVNTITKPITYRQFSKPVDLEDTQLMYKDAYEKVEEELYNAQEDLKEIGVNLKSNKDKLSDEEAELYRAKIVELQRLIEALKFRKFHLEDQMRAISMYSSGTVNPIPEETYVFDWTYDSIDFSVSLSDEEIYHRAIQELDAIANAKIHALSNCNVRASRCSTEELIDMCRWYSHPVSAARYKLRDIAKSSYYDDIMTSDSMERLSNAAIEETRHKSEVDFLNSINETAKECAERAMQELQKVYAEAANEEARLTAGGKAEKKQKVTVPENTGRKEDEASVDKEKPAENKKNEMPAMNGGIIIEEG